jgi:tetratricopeptide (TPR) repeat protein
MGFCLRGNGDKEGAYLHFSRAVANAPDQADYRLEMAQSALEVGEFAEADRQYQEALKLGPDNPAVLILAAKAMVWQGRPQKNAAQAVKLGERACALTEWKSRECAFALADLYIEAGRVLEGMGLKRRLKEGASAQAAPR